jgi:hypothetical protein
MGLGTAGDDRFTRGLSFLIRLNGSFLGCLEGIEVDALDCRGVLDCREWPFVAGLEVAAGLCAVIDDDDDGGLTEDLDVEFIVTVFVIIFGGAFFAFRLASDMGCFGAGSALIVDEPGWDESKECRINLKQKARDGVL